MVWAPGWAVEGTVIEASTNVPFGPLATPATLVESNRMSMADEAGMPEPDTFTVEVGGPTTLESRTLILMVRLDEPVAVPAGVVTLILPVLAPAGTVAFTVV